MQRIISLLIFSGLSLFGFSQADTLSLNPVETNYYFNWGSKTTKLTVARYGTRTDKVLVNVHGDELTAVDAAKVVLKKTGGTLIEIKSETRLIRFETNGRKYQFDPNRIFTSKGLVQNLKFLNGPVSATALKKVKAFAAFVIKRIPVTVTTIVALHNNVDHKYSIESYKVRRDHSRDASIVFINKQKDPDNFFLVTNAKTFSALKKAGFNVVHQDKLRAKDDGSLSVYFARKRKAYVNVEAQHGSLEEQIKMLSALMTL